MNTGRRDSMRLIGAAALAVGTGHLLSACSGAVRPSAAGREAQVPGLDPILHDVLFHASLAPSGHNAQPWVVRVLEPNRLLIGTVRDRWLPAVDPDNRELLLSLGCFLENLIVTARHNGLEVDYRVTAATSADSELLEVTLRPADPAPFPLDRMLSRRTVRSGHLKQELRIADVQALSAPFRGRVGQQLGLSGRVQFIVRASYLARYPDPVSLRMPVSRFVTGLSGQPASSAGVG